ncbi:transglycosylase domain-containing protein [Streptomyces sp. NBC_01443]|uniref:transglycosylase domain-containing protein n=1 Tax=Streptomyces sp. NBC_01443 TaxID=2903868 RepID=UPI002256A4A1|nr:transglycosylase domain-containing protein [Streptomyces sp. NBC_01443]MCX4629676.1 penicillin-binding protein [Streptomyces sp. NBC_01443]
MSDQSPPPGWTPRDPDTPAGPPAQQPSAQQPQQPQKPSGEKQSRRAADKAERKRKRTGWRRLVPTWRMVLGAVLLLALLVIGALIAGYLLVRIPPANAAATAQSNLYLYADGSQLARDGEVNRVNVPLSQIPRTVQEAVLAAEDRDFYSERAVDPKAMIRAAWNTATGKGTQSGSTITQQYVKNYYLGQEQTITRKVKEFFIAIKLGREKSKDYILEGYLNTSYFGRNAYGIQAAAQAYYGKDVGKLTTAEGAYLATLLNSPSAFDVVAHPQSRARAVARWNYVLDGMVKKQWLPAAERTTTRFPEPGKVRPAAGLSGQRGYLVEAVKDYIVEHKILDEKTLAEGGHRITTTIDKRRQNAFVDAVDEKMVGKLDPETRKADRVVRAGGVSIDPATGKVIAMYGGIDYTKQYVNNATRHDYQVASTFKPFVFAAAVENDSRTQDGRLITPNTVYNGDNKRRVVGTRTPYAPENEGQLSYGNIPVTTATDLSVNAVFAQMAVDVGTAKVKKTAIDLGIPENTPNFVASPAMALGTMQASVLDMAQAYATLADHGRYTPYTLVEKITKGSDSIHLPDRTPKQAVSREAADTTTSMLVSVVDNGTGTAALAAGHPAAGKTGTGELDRSAWFAAYTPDLVTVVSMMGQDPDTGALESLYGALDEARIGGGGYPARIWAQYTKTALEGSDPLDFDLELQPGAAPSPPPFIPSSPEPTPDESTPESPAPPSRPNRPNRPTPPDGEQDQGGRNQGQDTEGGTTEGDTTEGQGNEGTTGGTTTGTTGAATSGTTAGTTAGVLGGVTGGRPRSRPPSAYLE